MKSSVHCVAAGSKLNCGDAFFNTLRFIYAEYCWGSVQNSVQCAVVGSKLNSGHEFFSYPRIQLRCVLLGLCDKLGDAPNHVPTIVVKHPPTGHLKFARIPICESSKRTTPTCPVHFQENNISCQATRIRHHYKECSSGRSFRNDQSANEQAPNKMTPRLQPRFRNDQSANAQMSNKMNFRLQP